MPVMRRLSDLQGRLVHDDFVVARFNKPASDVFELFTSLDEQIVTSRRKLHGNTLSSVTGPDIKARVARPPMDS